MLEPKQISVYAVAAILFRKGVETTEDAMKPDAGLVLKMRELKLRVHDLVSRVPDEETAAKLVELYSWYDNRSTSEAIKLPQHLRPCAGCFAKICSTERLNKAVEAGTCAYKLYAEPEATPDTEKPTSKIDVAVLGDASCSITEGKTCDNCTICQF